MKQFCSVFMCLLTLWVAACTPKIVPTVTAPSTPTPALLPTPTASPAPTSTPTPAPTLSPTPQPNVVLRFFYDWSPQDPFNLNGKGLNSKKDAGEPDLVGLKIKYAEQSYSTDDQGTVHLQAPNPSGQISIQVLNTNAYPGSKDLAALGIQFNLTLYEPRRVAYGPNFTLDLQDDNCQKSNNQVLCEVGLSDGYMTSPYKGENYLYSSPWTWDKGLNFEDHFVKPLRSGEVSSPGGGMYRLGEKLGKTIAEYSNTNNQGVPYGYPYLINEPKMGVMTHLLMDIRNETNVPVYAPAGGTVCQGNSSAFAICAGDVKIDINDFRAIPAWKYGLEVTRGQQIGWTDTQNNISGSQAPFPLIHLGSFEHQDRPFTLSHFPYLSAEQIVMGAKPDSKGQLVLLPLLQVRSDYAYRVHLPHAPVYTD